MELQRVSKDKQLELAQVIEKNQLLEAALESERSSAMQQAHLLQARASELEARVAAMQENESANGEARPHMEKSLVSPVGAQFAPSPGKEQLVWQKSLPRVEAMIGDVLKHVSATGTKRENTQILFSIVQVKEVLQQVSAQLSLMAKPEVSEVLILRKEVEKLGQSLNALSQENDRLRSQVGGENNRRVCELEEERLARLKLQHKLDDERKQFRKALNEAEGYVEKVRQHMQAPPGLQAPNQRQLKVTGKKTARSSSSQRSSQIPSTQSRLPSLN